MKILDQKSDQRLKYQKVIESFSFFDLIQKSQNLVNFFQKEIVHQISFQRKFLVSFYPFDNEPQINIESEARNEPFEVAYVRITDWNQRAMVAAKARRDQPGEWEELAISPQKKIFQPTPTQPICAPHDVAAILVPGLAFSKQGERLGRGAGFYDRFLNKYPQALRIGVAFEEQITPKLAIDSWDEKVDIILTDQAAYKVLEMKCWGEWKSQGKVLSR